MNETYLNECLISGGCISAPLTIAVLVFLAVALVGVVGWSIYYLTSKTTKPSQTKEEKTK